VSDQPAAGQPHAILPVFGTYVRESDAEVVDSPLPWDYPILADCKFCTVEIRNPQFLTGEWEHVGPSEDQVSDLILAKWEASPHERHRVALALARDLKTEGKPGDRIESIEKLAVRYETSTSAARAARNLLLSAKIIIKQGGRHYHLT
jgi:hypothetical protein